MLCAVIILAALPSNNTLEEYDPEYDVSDYYPICADLIYEYGNYLHGQKILTVIKAASVSKSKVKAEISGQAGSALAFDFGDNDVRKLVKEGELICIVGEIPEGQKGSTITVGKCIIAGKPDSFEAVEGERLNQQSFCETKKSEYEAEIAAAAAEERNAYASGCIAVDYTSVARNPDDYKGELIKMRGKVIQVSEGLLGSVTMRINEGGAFDKTWYVTYTHKDGESRILENDWITCYGECNGVTSYSSIFGAIITIPALKMKYYE